MAHKRKDTYTASPQWWKHLRPYTKRRVAKRERKAEQALIRGGTARPVKRSEASPLRAGELTRIDANLLNSVRLHGSERQVNRSKEFRRDPKNTGLV